MSERLYIVISETSKSMLCTKDILSVLKSEISPTKINYLAS
jgi:hypothetical protein